MHRHERVPVAGAPGSCVVGVGGDRRASSSRGVGRSSPNRLLGGIPSAEVDVGPYIYIIKKSTKRRVFIPFPPSVIYIL